MTDRAWLLCLQLWTYTHWRVFVWIGTRLAPRVLTFPDRPYTRIVSNLTTLGLTQAQILTAWESNGTFARFNAEYEIQRRALSPDEYKRLYQGEWIPPEATE